jgi:peptidoglycan/LPS O-acetylase OafA/YrhL
MKISTNRHQPHIDGLRAVAVVAVLLFHLDVGLFKGGFVGVDVFFVISGFLITRLIRDEIARTGSFRFGNFYARRVRRLAPALIATLALSTLAAVLLLSTGSLKGYGSELVASLLSLSNIHFWQQADYFDVSTKLKPLLHTWSLSVEEQFYLLWPALAVIAFTARLRRFAPWLFAAIATASLAANFPFSRGFEFEPGSPLAGLSNGKSTIFFLLPFRVFELGIGAMLLFVPRGGAPRKWLDDALFLAGMALIAISVLTFGDQMLFPTYWALAPCLGAALAIYAGGDARTGRAIANPLAVGIGTISYSLYLAHWPIIVFWSYSRGASDWQGKVILGLAATLLGYLGWRYVETPFRQRRIRLRILAFPAVALLAVGIAMARSDGWAWRCSNPLQFDISGNAQDFHRSHYGGYGYRPGFVDGKATSADIVLLGDSHGAHYAEGMNKEVAQPFGASLYICAGPSYLHMPGIGRVTAGYDPLAFARNDVPALRKVVSASERVPIFVISQSWCFQQAIADRIDETGARTNEGVDFEEVVAGLLRLKRMFGISTLVVIGEVPGAGINCFEEMTRPALSQRFDPEQVRRRRLPNDAADFNRRMAKAAQQTGEFCFFDPADALCDTNGCRNIDDLGRPIYSDAYHLSIFGSRLVIAHFAPQLTQLLKARKGEAAKEPAGIGQFAIAPANMAAEQGHCFVAIVQCEMPGDRESRSSVTVWENGVQIGPAHQAHKDIRTSGGGRFSYWAKGNLYFSTTDNSDPRTNGRKYEIRWPL